MPCVKCVLVSTRLLRCTSIIRRESLLCRSRSLNGDPSLPYADRLNFFLREAVASGTPGVGHALADALDVEPLSFGSATRRARTGLRSVLY